jgi:hypothetical protein
MAAWNENQTRLRLMAEQAVRPRNSSRLIPLVDDQTHVLLEAGKNKLH